MPTWMDSSSRNIKTEINVSGDIRKSIEKFMDLIKNETLSKSKGNFVTARDFISMYGADPARLFFYTAPGVQEVSVCL